MLCIIVGCLPGCGSSSGLASDPIPLRVAEGRAPVTRSASDVVATVNGVPVRGEELETGLREAAGAQVLREAVLDRLITAELDRRGMVLTEADLAAERARLDEALTEGVSQTTANQTSANQIKEAVQRRRGLGPARLAATVRRSAGLRRLVADTVEVTDADIGLAERIRFGPRHVLRVIETATAGEASEARRLALAGGLEAFARAAAERSLDASGAAGGLLGEVSLDDPAYPDAMRTAARATAVGAVSEVVGLGSSFVVLRVDAVMPARPGPTADERVRMKAELQRRKERVAMEALAGSLLDRASVTVIDDAIAWNWQTPSPD